MSYQTNSRGELDGVLFTKLLSSPIETIGKLLEQRSFYWLVSIIMCLEGLVMTSRKFLAKPKTLYAPFEEMTGPWEVGALIAFLVLVSVLIGYLGWWIMSYLCFLVGRWFKGEGTFRDVHVAYGWSHSPTLVFLPFILVALAMYPSIPSAWQWSFTLSLVLINLAFAIWKFTLTSIAIAIAHQFSGLKGFGVLCLCGISAFAIFLGVVLGGIYAFQMFQGI